MKLNKKVMDPHDGP